MKKDLRFLTNESGFREGLFWYVETEKGFLILHKPNSTRTKKLKEWYFSKSNPERKLTNFYIKENNMEQKTLKPFFMLYVEGANAPTFKYDNITSARAEAELLANKMNVKVTILVSVEQHEIAPKTIVKSFEPHLPF